MVLKTIGICGFAVAALALPTHLAAQAAPAEAQVQEAQTAPAPQGELEQIQARLAQIQQAAQQDAQLQAAQEAFAKEITAAMAQLDSATRVQVERSQSFQADVEAAREAGDNARLHELAAEGEQLQAALAAARSRVLQQPQMVEKRQALQQQIVAKMVEIEPETQALIARLQELKAGGSQ